MVPNWSRVSRTNCSISSSLDTSVWKQRTCAPSVRICSPTVSSNTATGRMSQRATAAPSLANLLAMDSPCPRPAAVMRATLPSNLPMPALAPSLKTVSDSD